MIPMIKKFKLNSSLGNYRKGQTISLVVDCNGVPVAYYWRSRYVDAKMDNCMEAVDAEKKEEVEEEKPKKIKKLKKEETINNDNF